MHRQLRAQPDGRSVLAIGGGKKPQWVNANLPDESCDRSATVIVALMEVQTGQQGRLEHGPVMRSLPSPDEIGESAQHLIESNATADAA